VRKKVTMPASHALLSAEKEIEELNIEADIMWDFIEQLKMENKNLKSQIKDALKIISVE
jgi:hypothetical protein